MSRVSREMPREFRAGAERLLAVLADERLILAVEHLVTLKALLVREALVTDVALERFHGLVDRLLVLVELFWREKLAFAMSTAESHFFPVYLLVALQEVGSGETFAADLTGERLIVGMSRHVLAEIVLGKEHPVAFGAFAGAVAVSPLDMQLQCLAKRECSIALLTGMDANLTRFQFPVVLSVVRFLSSVATLVVFFFVQITMIFLFSLQFLAFSNLQP